MKHKIKYKFMAAFIAAISLFCLSTTASADIWSGLAGGATSDGGFTLKDTPFGYLPSADVFAWRADLYISANQDGKIDKDKDTVGSTYLPLVGSVLCVSPTYANGEWWKTYIQTNYTSQEETRNSFDSKGSSSGTGEDLGMVQYTLPTLKEFDPADGIYEDASGHKVAIAVAEPGKGDPFEGQYGLSTNFSVVQQRLTGDDAADYTAKLITQLIEKNDTFAKGILLMLSEKSPIIYNDFKTKAQAEPSVTDAFYKYILPNGETPMVEWALVVTPIYRFECYAPFYCSTASAGIDDTKFGLPYIGGGNCVALDAYWFAQSERTTLALGKDGKYAGLTYVGGGGVTKNVWQNQTIGLLSFFLENHAGAVGAAAYCTEKDDPHLGVFTNVAKTTTQSGWTSLLKTMPSEYAKRGGIAVFTTEITTPEAPVYYHTYTYRIDENDKDSLPTGYTKGTYSTDDPKLLNFLDKLDTPTVSVTKGTLPEGNTFYPKKGAEDLGLNGLVVAAVSPQPTLNPQPGSQDEYPILSTTDKYLERVLDSTEAQLNPTNPLADTATLKTGKATPDNTADDPKEFHVHVDNKPKIAEDT